MRKIIARLFVAAVVFSTAMTVARVTTLDGAPLSYMHASNVLTIELQSPAQAGGDVEVVVEYYGDPVSAGYIAWGNLPWNGDPFLWTLSEPYGAMDWWPNKDHPADKADSVRVTILLDSDLRVGSNGPLSLPILHYGYRGQGAYEGINDESGWKRVTEVLPVFEYGYGPYPFPDEKYGHAHVTFRGAMENQTMTSMGNIGLGLVSHELAHVWYGDLVTNKTWPHLWRHEGFATQGAMLFWESDLDRF